MKHFGDYLLEQKLITEEQLVQSLLDQVRSLPTTAEIVVENMWLSFASVLEVFKYQSRNLVEFKSACSALNLWTPEMDEKLKKEIQRRRVPLGHMLCQKGFVSSDVLAKALEDFNRNQSNAEVIEFKPVTDDGPHTPHPASSSEESFEFEFHQVDESVSADYLELLNDDKRAELEKDVLSWESLGHDRENLPSLDQSFQRVYRDYHTIKGSARFIRADLSERVIHRAEDIISFCKRFLEKLTPTDFERLTSLNLRVFDILWHLRDHLQSEGSEKGFWENADFRKAFMATLSDLKAFDEELQQRNFEVDLDSLKEVF